MKGTPEQAPAEQAPEKKTPLVLYKKEETLQISPPVTRKIFWFWTPEPPSSLEERGALEEIGKRIGDFCQEEGKKVRASIFTGVIEETGREEGLIMVEVSRELLNERERMILMRKAPEPPRRYLQKEKAE